MPARIHVAKGIIRNGAAGVVLGGRNAAQAYAPSDASPVSNRIQSGNFLNTRLPIMRAASGDRTQHANMVTSTMDAFCRPA